MKKILAVFAVLGLLASTMPSASAFSTDKTANQNPDGSEKFSDPDEQMPAFITGSGNQSNSGASLNENEVTPPSYGDVNNGAQSFDRATSHMENSR